jgi:C4-dicarboxylate transporter, DctM subunit
MSEISLGIGGLILILALFLTGMELGFAMAMVGVAGFTLLRSFDSALNLLAKDIFDVFSNYGFTVIPLFVLMGQIAYESGTAKRLFTSADKFVGHIPGGIAMATVVGATGFKAICGSSPATTATFALAAIPEMDRFGYSRKLSTGVVATVGTLGVLIPPSVFLILFGIITEQSIGKLFLAGILPGLLSALFFIAVIWGWCRINPAAGPRGVRSTWKARISSLPEVLWIVLIFLFLIGGMMMGLFTPTEAGSVVTFVLIIVCMLRRDITPKGLVTSVKETLSVASMTIVLLLGSTVLGHFLTATTIPMFMAEWIVSLPVHRYMIMIFIAIIYLLGGSFIDDLAFMILATPIFYPAVMKLGFDPLWFGMIVGITVMAGVVIPPVAINVFVVRSITKAPFSEIYKGVYPFLISLIAVFILLFFVPQIATFLPNVLMK